MTQETPKPRTFRRLLIWAASIGVLLFLFRYQWLPPFAAWLNVSDPQLPVRYVVPLPGGNDMRPFAAAALVRAGLAERAVVLKNEASPDIEDGIQKPTHEVTRQVLLRRGVPADKILLLEGESRSTFSDFQIIGRIWEQDPDATIAIVTDPSHSRRARWAADKVLPHVANRICVIATVNDQYDARIWWQSEEGLHATVSEYLKLAFYEIKYGSPGRRLAWITAFLGMGAAIVWLRRRRGRIAHQEITGSTSASISSTTNDV